MFKEIIEGHILYNEGKKYKGITVEYMADKLGAATRLPK